MTTEAMVRFSLILQASGGVIILLIGFSALVDTVSSGLTLTNALFLIWFAINAFRALFLCPDLMRDEK